MTELSKKNLEARDFAFQEIAKVTFSVERVAPFGHSVSIVGSTPSLGNWNPVKAVKLLWTSGHFWVGTVTFEKSEMNTVVQFKFIEYESATNCIWES